jgi:hypothetical protein
MSSLIRQVEDLPRSRSIVWMFLTVILGALAILSGILPLQVGGVLLIAAGMLTPIALTDRQPPAAARKAKGPEVSQAALHASLLTRTGAEAAPHASRLTPPRITTNPRSERGGQRGSAREQLEAVVQELRDDLIVRHGLDTLLAESLIQQLAHYASEARSPIRRLSTREIANLWRTTLSGLTVDRFAAHTNADPLTLLAGQRLLLQHAATVLRRMDDRTAKRRPGLEPEVDSPASASN